MSMETEHTPIVKLIVRLQQAGQDITMAAGYMSALWHEGALKSCTATMQLHNARRAAQSVIDAISAYDAAQTSEAKNASEAA